MLLARLANPEEVGRFSLTMAISAPVFLLLGMNLRVVQATDAARRWRLEDYLVLRHLLNVLATVVTMVVGLVLQMSLADLAALLAVSGAKSSRASARPTTASSSRASGTSTSPSPRSPGASPVRCSSPRATS